MVSFFIECSAQDDMHPSYGAEIENTIAKAVINDKEYNDVTVEVNSANHGVYFYGVLINVKDKEGKKVYKKRFRESTLYTSFDDGSMQIKKQQKKGDDITFMQLCKNPDNNEFELLIKDRRFNLNNWLIDKIKVKRFYSYLVSCLKKGQP